MKQKAATIVMKTWNNLLMEILPFQQIGYGSNRKTRHLNPAGYKAFLVNNVRDVDLLLMHNRTFAAEYVLLTTTSRKAINTRQTLTAD